MIIEYCATRPIPKMKIDFCPNKQRLISLSFPLQLNSVDSRSPSGLQSLPNFKMVIKMCFNSRSPSGLRQNRVACLFSFWCFNSRSPSGLRQASHLPLCTTILVSIHAAQAGCDLGISTAQHLQKGFNSRSPSGLRHAWPSSLPGESFVSIHAAQAGCDVFLAILVDVGKCFNSRSPSGLRHCHLVPRGK